MASKLMATPGGPIAPEHVFGRDDLITDLWEALETGSVLLTAERRIGKTNVIRKMQAEAPPGKLVYWWDVSSSQSAGEFAQGVYERVEAELSRRKVASTTARRWLSELAGVEITGVKLPSIAAQHWKTLLQKTIGDLVEHCGRDVVFLWDEVPWMLDKIQRGTASAPTPEGENIAMDVLDALRDLRQTHPSLRMVFTGSIGLHHVLSTLRAQGYRNSAVNDMPLVEVPPLELAAARDLSLELLRNEAIPTDEADVVAQALAEGVGGFSFYIHLLVADLRRFRRRGQKVVASDVASLINAALEDDADSWQMRHYSERLASYYGPRAKLARAILDEVAAAPTPLNFATLLNAARAQEPTVGADDVRDLLGLLGRDHYLTQSASTYRFRYTLVERWWRVHRGLTP